MNYQARNELLAEMGYSTYQIYLNSPLWASIRERVYAAKGRTCLRCKTADAEAVHHTKYDDATMRGDTLNCLVPICDHCHVIEHGMAKWRKIQPGATTATIRRRAESKAHDPVPPKRGIERKCRSCGATILKRTKCNDCRIKARKARRRRACKKQRPSRAAAVETLHQKIKRLGLNPLAFGIGRSVAGRGRRGAARPTSGLQPQMVMVGKDAQTANGKQP